MPRTPGWLTLLIEQGSPGWQEKPEQDGSGAERGLLADGGEFHILSAGVRGSSHGQ